MPYNYHCKTYMHVCHVMQVHILRYTCIYILMQVRLGQNSIVCNVHSISVVSTHNCRTDHADAPDCRQQCIIHLYW